MNHFKHDFSSASSLGSLNTGGAQLVRAAIRAALVRLREDSPSKPIRLLDMGCGQSPYLDSSQDMLEDLSVTLVDINDDVLNKHWMVSSSKYHKDFFEFTGDGSTTECRSYHIIVLAGVLHELRAQLALKAIDPNVELAEERSKYNPAVKVLEQLGNAPFVSPETVIILSDLFHWHFWDADELEKARQYQFSRFGHADPASAFLTGEEVLRHSLCAGFRLISYDETTSVDPSHEICSHPVYGLIYKSRRVFCATLNRRPPLEDVVGRQDDQSYVVSVSRRCHADLPEIIREGIAAKPKEQNQNHEYLNDLQKLLASDRVIEAPDYHKILGEHLFDSLAKSAGHLTRDWFATTQVSSPQAIMLWFGVNSLILEDRDGRGYALVKDGRWVCHKVYLQKEGAVRKDENMFVDRKHDQDWCTLCFNFFASPDAVKDMTASHSWLDKLLVPSIYRWMTSLSKDNPSWRSVSVVSLAQVDSHSKEASARVVEDALILQLYSPHSPTIHGSLQGHTLVTLPGNTEAAHSLGFELDEKCSGYCSEGETYSGPYKKTRAAVLCALGALYLDILFLTRGQSLKEKQLEDLLNSFEKRWLDNPKVRFFDSTIGAEVVKTWIDEEKGIVPLPTQVKDRIFEFLTKVREFPQQTRPLPTVWTCFIVRQPGSTKKPIATIMLMSDRPCNPALLELLTAQFEEIFFSIRSVEVERVVRLSAAAEGRSRAVQVMLRSFGHDGRRYGTAITSALGKGSNVGELSSDERMAIGKLLAQNLASRLYAYQTLIGDGRIQGSSYKDERDRSSIDKRVALTDFIRSEVAIILLRCAVDESEFVKLAKLLKIVDVKKDLTNFALNAVNQATPFPSEILKQLEESLHGIVRLSWEGLQDIRIPTDLDATGNKSPISRISVGLSFILSELLTNVFRHQFSQDNDLPKKLPVSLAFSVQRFDKAYDLELRTKPAFPPTKNVKPNPTGLASLEFTERALGVQIPKARIKAGNEYMDLPFPEYKRETEELISRIKGISHDALLLRDEA